MSMKEIIRNTIMKAILPTAAFLSSVGIPLGHMAHKAENSSQSASRQSHESAENTSKSRSPKGRSNSQKGDITTARKKYEKLNSAMREKQPHNFGYIKTKPRNYQPDKYPARQSDYHQPRHSGSIAAAQQAHSAETSAPATSAHRAPSVRRSVSGGQDYSDYPAYHDGGDHNYDNGGYGSSGYGSSGYGGNSGSSSDLSSPSNSPKSSGQSRASDDSDSGKNKSYFQPNKDDKDKKNDKDESENKTEKEKKLEELLKAIQEDKKEKQQQAQAQPDGDKPDATENGEPSPEQMEQARQQILKAQNGGQGPDGVQDPGWIAGMIQNPLFQMLGVPLILAGLTKTTGSLWDWFWSPSAPTNGATANAPGSAATLSDAGKKSADFRQRAKEIREDRLKKAPTKNPEDEPHIDQENNSPPAINKSASQPAMPTPQTVIPGQDPTKQPTDASSVQTTDLEPGATGTNSPAITIDTPISKLKMPEIAIDGQPPIERSISTNATPSRPMSDVALGKRPIETQEESAINPDLDSPYIDKVMDRCLALFEEHSKTIPTDLSGALAKLETLNIELEKLENEPSLNMDNPLDLEIAALIVEIKEKIGIIKEMLPKNNLAAGVDYCVSWFKGSDSFKDAIEKKAREQSAELLAQFEDLEKDYHGKHKTKIAQLKGQALELIEKVTNTKNQ